jgi:purine catabolism regulator
VLGPGAVIPALEPAAAYERAVGVLVAGLRETIDLVGADEGCAASAGARTGGVAERPSPGWSRRCATITASSLAERMLDPLLAETALGAATFSTC